MSTENIPTSNEELNLEQLADVSGGHDSGQYRLGKRDAKVGASEDDQELSDNELGQVSGGSGDGGQYYRLGGRKDA
jgi:hypothetical protein